MTILCVDVQDVYDIEKEKMLLGKRLVFTTLNFDIIIQHPYKPLVVAIRKF
jgi:cyclin T